MVSDLLNTLLGNGRKYFLVSLLLLLLIISVEMMCCLVSNGQYSESRVRIYRDGVYIF